MSTTLQFRRYNTATTASTTGAVGEITINTDLSTVVVHDGVTAGGTPLATQSNVTSIAAGGVTLSSFAGNIIPSATNTYWLGTSSKAFETLYVSSTGINIGSFAVTGTGGVFGVANTNSNIALLASSAILSGNGSNVAIQSGDVRINSGITSGVSAEWDFYSNAAVRFPNGRLQSTAYPGVTSSIPTSSKGQSGDIQGLIASDGSFVYICYTDYTTGTNDIWAKVATTSTTW